MYLTIQILACDYAIGYHEAIVSAALSDMFGGIEDELAAIIILQDERNMLYQFKEQGTDLYIGLDGTIGGFVSACPVTVLIETREGEEIARVETGKVSLAEGIFSHFDIMGTEGEKKTGFFDSSSTKSNYYFVAIFRIIVYNKKRVIIQNPL